MTYKHHIGESDAAMAWKWMKNQGGLLVWKSINLSAPDTEWLTPVTQKDGMKTIKPSAYAAPEPALTITDPAEVGVITQVEFARFRVTTRLSSNGLSLKLSDASNRKLNQTLAKAGEMATYYFNYETHEAVVLAQKGMVSLAEWAQANGFS